MDITQRKGLGIANDGRITKMERIIIQRVGSMSSLESIGID